MEESKSGEVRESTPGRRSAGWLLFQIVAVVAGLSWFGTLAYRYMILGPLGSSQEIVWALTPVLAVTAVILGIFPRVLTPLSATGWRSRWGLFRLAILGIAVAWIVIVAQGPMLTRLLVAPFAPAKVMPVLGGVFFHVVIQHWFLSVSAVVLALFPSRFESLWRVPVRKPSEVPAPP